MGQRFLFTSLDTGARIVSFEDDGTLNLQDAVDRFMEEFYSRFSYSVKDLSLESVTFIFDDIAFDGKGRVSCTFKVQRVDADYCIFSGK